MLAAAAALPAGLRSTGRCTACRSPSATSTSSQGITGSPWVGLAHFERFVTSYNFWPIMREHARAEPLQPGGRLPVADHPGAGAQLRRRAPGSGERCRWSATRRTSSRRWSWSGSSCSSCSTRASGLVNQLLGLVGIGPIDFMGNAAATSATSTSGRGVWQTSASAASSTWRR